MVYQKWLQYFAVAFIIFFAIISSYHITTHYAHIPCHTCLPAGRLSESEFSGLRNFQDG